jgi:hypothetical protein
MLAEKCHVLTGELSIRLHEHKVETVLRSFSVLCHVHDTALGAFHQVLFVSFPWRNARDRGDEWDDVAPVDERARETQQLRQQLGDDRDARAAVYDVDEDNGVIGLLIKVDKQRARHRLWQKVQQQHLIKRELQPGACARRFKRALHDSATRQCRCDH